MPIFWLLSTKLSYKTSKILWGCSFGCENLWISPALLWNFTTLTMKCQKFSDVKLHIVLHSTTRGFLKDCIGIFSSRKVIKMRSAMHIQRKPMPFHFFILKLCMFTCKHIFLIFLPSFLWIFHKYPIFNKTFSLFQLWY